MVGRATAAGLSGALVILGAEDEAGARARGDTCRSAWDRGAVLGRRASASGGKFAADPAQAAARRSQAAIEAQPLSRAVGEIGLDYHYDFSPRDVQQQVFREQIRLAGTLRLPIVIHTREAEDDTFRILDEERRARRRRRLPLLHRRPRHGAGAASTSASTCRWPAS